MDLVIDPKGAEALQECYLLASVGKSRKLFKHGDYCTLPLSSASHDRKGRIDILRRVGSASMHVDTTIGAQDVCIRSDGFFADVKLSVSSTLNRAGGDAEKPTPEAVREAERAQAMEYLRESRLQELLGEGIRAVLKKKPENPRKFLAEYLAAEQETGKPAAEPAAAPQPFKPYTFKPSIGSWLTFLPDKESELLPTEFEVVLDRSAGEDLGFELSEPNGATLQVQSVSAGAGLLGAWARTNRSLAVEVGDHILSVNDVRGSSAKLRQECGRSKPLRMQVKKQSAFNHSVDCQQWLQSLKSSFQYPCRNQNRQLTPGQELCEDELAALLAKYDADGDGKLSLGEFTRLARSELWHMKTLPKAEPAPTPPWMLSQNQGGGGGGDEPQGYKPPKPKPQTGEHLKLGVYKREDEEAMGALSLRYTESDDGYARSFVFTVTATTGASAGEELWSAPLEPAGFDGSGREMWRLSGRPVATVFLQDESSRTVLTECDLLTVPLAISSSSMDAGSGALVSSGVRRTLRTRQRRVWTFQEELCGMFFSEPVGLPLEQRSKNFVKAVVANDPTTSETGAPNTDEVVKQYARYSQSLPDGPIKRQIELVNIYTRETPLYHEMNRALREDNLEKMKVFGSFIKELRDVFLTDHEYQITKPFIGTVWRGISRVPDLEKAKKAYQPGKDFLWPAFTSTTTDKNVAMRWGQIVFEILVDPPEGMYDDEVWEFAPADIKEFSAFKSESEVLFPPNVKFRILEVREEQGKPLVVCVATALDGVGGQVEFGGGEAAPALVQEAATDGVLLEPLVKQLVDMGYPEVRARRALRANRNNLEAAKTWLEERKEDPTIDAPMGESEKAVIQRVQTRPKIGMYVSDKGSRGRLCVQKGRCGKRRAYIFTVVELESEEVSDEDYWVARLVHRGQNPQGRDVWGLDGHPLGGTFVNDKGRFLECQDDGTKQQRQVWTFQGDEETASPKAAAAQGPPPSALPSATPAQKAAALTRTNTFTWDSRRADRD